MAHRILLVMWAMLRTGEDFDFGRLGIEEGPFERVVRKKYRVKAVRATKAPRQAAAGL